MPPIFESKFEISQTELDELIRPQTDENGKSFSNIANFYNDRNVFLTGATGFVGRLIVEKLLRACTNIGQIYILIRAKRGKSARERIRELTNSIVFDGLRRMGIDLGEKLVPIEGSLTEECYALSEEQLNLLAENVSIIFHSAASVNFVEPLYDATKTNLIGTLNAIKLAKKLPKLVSMIYVSTAYSNCLVRPEVQERVYAPPVMPECLIQMIESLDRGSFESIKHLLMGRFPNTYTYTKNLAEALCSHYSQELPILICRPSVIVSTWREPIRGYVDNINGGNGINYGPASGLSVVMQADPSVVLDYVPVDLVVNCIIALGWFCAKFFELKQTNFTPIGSSMPDDLNERMQSFYNFKLEELKRLQVPLILADTPVFHITSGVDNPITLCQFKDKMIEYANRYPNLQLYRRPRMDYVNSHYQFKIKRYFGNTLVAKLFDLVHRFKPFAPEIYDKDDTIVRKSLAFRSDRIDHFGQTIVFFLTHHWDFRPENRNLLIDKFMSEEDRRLFPCDMRNLDWDQYCQIYALGIRKFLLKEPIDTLDKARSRLGIVEARNSTFKIALSMLIVYCLFKLIFSNSIYFQQ